MTDQKDPFSKLSNVVPPPPSGDAKAKAMSLAMAAFDEAQSKKNVAAPQGSAPTDRQTFIARLMKGLFAMENRVVVTAAVTGLLLLPLGYMLYNNTALTPPAPPVNLPLPEQPLDQERADDLTVVADAVERQTTEHQTSEELAPPPAEPAPIPSGEAPVAESLAIVRSETVVTQSTPIGTLAGAQNKVADGLMTDMVAMPAAAAPEAEPYLGDDARWSQPEPGGDVFEEVAQATIKSVAAEPVSTFSIDVDTASYAYVRRALNEGWLPNPDAVRVEELINAFDYDLARPATADEPFAATIDIAPSPWDAGKQVMRVAVQGYDLAAEDRPPANLVFLIDTSGSMDAPDKLPLLITSFSLMLDALTEDDTVSIVTYAGSAGVALPPTSVADKSVILAALNRLGAGGSTAGAEGIELAYRLAADAFVDGGSNQVILATDGDFNVGLSDPSGLEDFISAKRDEGVFLSVLGFGTGNLVDHTMQALAQNGNGTAYYIDGLREAQKVLVHNITQTLVPIATDVKIQIEFNPAQVAEYRLIGYETRALNREDFNNDRVDAGDVGAGASVTAIYELTPVGSDSVLVDPLRYGDADADIAEGSSAEIGFFKLRYKLPGETESRLLTVPVTPDRVADDLSEVDSEFRFALAVAGFGQKLSHNPFVDQLTFTDIRALAQAARGEDADGYRSEFLALVDLAAALDR